MHGGLLDEDGVEPAEPAGILLGQNSAIRVHDEEVGREGACVTRAWQLARWYDGRRLLWMGRRKTSGTGEVRSHLNSMF